MRKTPADRVPPATHTGSRLPLPYRSRLWRAPLLIALFQVAPVAVQQDADGGLWVGLGYGMGSYAQQVFSCDGLTHHRDIELSTVSGILDYVFPSGTGGITAFAGTADASVGPVVSHVGSGSPPHFVEPRDGFFIGAMVGPEKPRFALRVGAMVLPDEQGAEVRPAIHLRLGDKEGIYARADLHTITFPGQLPMSSFGFGFGDESQRSVTGSLGLGFTTLEQGANNGAFVGNLAVPLGKRFDIMAGTVLGQGGVAVFNAGLRLNMRRK